MIGQTGELAVAVDGLAQIIDLILRHIARDVLSIFRELKVVIRPGRPLAQDMEGAFLHVMDLSGFAKEGLGIRL